MAKRDALVWARALVRALHQAPIQEWPVIQGRLLNRMRAMGDSAWIRRLPAVLPEALRRERAEIVQVSIAPSVDTPALRARVAKVLGGTVQDFTWIVDATLIAGVRVQAPSWILDASVAGRLQALGGTFMLGEL